MHIKKFVHKKQFIKLSGGSTIDLIANRRFSHLSFIECFIKRDTRATLVARGSPQNFAHSSYMSAYVSHTYIYMCLYTKGARVLRGTRGHEERNDLALWRRIYFERILTSRGRKGETTIGSRIQFIVLDRSIVNQHFSRRF